MFYYRKINTLTYKLNCYLFVSNNRKNFLEYLDKLKFVSPEVIEVPESCVIKVFGRAFKNHSNVWPTNK
jgi:hypothetical protein